MTIFLQSGQSLALIVAIHDISLAVPYNGPYNKIAAINALLAQLQQGAVISSYCKININFLTMISTLTFRICWFNLLRI